MPAGRSTTKWKSFASLPTTAIAHSRIQCFNPAMLNSCPKCHSENTYNDSTLWNCLDCSHEWLAGAEAPQQEATAVDAQVRDAYGNALIDGDAVTVIKDLKVKGSSSVVKVGTKVKSIRIVNGNDGHNIACRIDGIGAMNLKSEFVKKV